MKVRVNPDQSRWFTEVVVGDKVVTLEPTEVTADEGEALLQLQNKRGPFVVKVSGAKKKSAASDNEAPAETEDEPES